MPDELSSEDYFFFFPLCVSDSSAEAQADTGIQMGANADRAIVLLQHAGTERSGIAGIGRREGGGTITRGLQAQITFIKFINSKSGFKPASSPYKHLLPVLRKSGFSMHKLILHAAGELICAQLCLLGWIFYEKPTALLPLLLQQSPPPYTHTHTSVKISFPCINTKSNALIL